MRFVTAASMALAIGLPAGQARSADIFTMTYTGVVVEGVDFLGIFGPQGMDLSGDAFSETFYFLGGVGGVSGNEVGGVGLPSPSPAASVQMTINGASYSSGGFVNYGQAVERIVRTPGGPDHYESSSDADAGSVVFETFAHGDEGVSATLTANTPALFAGTSTGADCGLGICGFFRIGFGATGAELDVRSWSDTAPARAPAVPEPATWGMMVAGFGAIGARLRRRRSPAPASVS